MKCYHCGCKLGEEDTCGRCGADVRLYRKIIRTSNAYYNRGLEKARVRDLTGAAAALRTCLDLNKRHIEAHNLLGLVYYEMGEAVPALREWMISKNLKLRHNIAGTYIKDIQENRLDLDSMNQTIRKYNMALRYIQEDSEDLAVIQLKRIIIVNPRLIRAYQLLALLYMRRERFSLASEVLEKCLEIDRGNTVTLRYLKEARAGIAEQGRRKQRRVSHGEPEALKEELNGDQNIIPVHVRGVATYFMTAAYVLSGVILGVLLVFFLVVPGVRRAERSGYQEQLRGYEEKISSRDQNAAALERQIASLEKEKKDLQDALNANTEDGAGILNAYGVLLDIMEAYRTGNLAKVVELYPSLNGEAADQAKYQEMVQNIKNDYEGGLFDRLMAEAAEAREAEGEEELRRSLADYEAALVIRPETPEAMFWAGNIYHRLGQAEEAREYYTKVIEEYGDTEWAGQAEAQRNLLP